MENDQKISVDCFFGTVEIKTWFEATMTPSGDWLMEGNSCAIHRRRDGTIKDVNFSKSGCNMVVPMGHEEQPSLLARFVNRLWSNGKAHAPRNEVA